MTKDDEYCNIHDCPTHWSYFSTVCFKYFKSNNKLLMLTLFQLWR